MSIARIKKDDVVMCTAGVDAGKKGKVLQVVPSTNSAIVEGLNIRKKALRKTEDNPQGGIAEKEAPMALSNLMPFCPKCNKGVRISRERDDAKNSGRKCRVCSHAFDG